MKRIEPNQLISIFLLPLFFMAFSFHSLKAQDAKVMLQKMDEIIFSPKDKQGRVSIILINSKGNEKVREAEMMQKGTDRKIYRYTSPESQAGIATLSLPDGVMWLYMPAFGKPKKISLLSKSQAFTGTDFSYEDMATTPYTDRYIPEFLEEQESKYLLELIPISERSNYSKIIVHLNKTDFYPIRMEYFDQIGNKFKEANYKYKKSGKYWYAEEVIMADLNKQHMTKIGLKEVVFDQGLSDDLFTKEGLAPVKDE